MAKSTAQTTHAGENGFVYFRDSSGGSAPSTALPCHMHHNGTCLAITPGSCKPSHPFVQELLMNQRWSHSIKVGVLGVATLGAGFFAACDGLPEEIEQETL